MRENDLVKISNALSECERKTKQKDSIISILCIVILLHVI